MLIREIRIIIFDYHLFLYRTMSVLKQYFEIFTNFVETETSLVDTVYFT